MDKMEKSKEVIAFLILLSVSLFLSACSFIDSGRFDLDQLIVDVFDPQPGESILFMVDAPHGKLSDNEAWAARREMAQEWLEAFQNLAVKRQLHIQPLLTYQATGVHNSPLPQYARLGDQGVRLSDILSGTNLVIAMTEYSATAPLAEYAQQFPELRAASMPMVSRVMQDTALRADYRRLAQDCLLLADRLERAQSAELVFTTGDELFIDLRNRHSLMDGGQLHAAVQGERVINLPSGEAYIAPYEGELEGQPSHTRGQMPLVVDGMFVVLRVFDNRVTQVLGRNLLADERRAWFAGDPARTNIAELGLGCNRRAQISGSVLEDEKVYGVHIAFGLSDHIGGITTSDDFNPPGAALHQDVVYPFGQAVSVTSVVLEYPDGEREQIIQDGAYTVMPRHWSINLRGVYLLWILLVAGSLNFISLDQVRSRSLPASRRTIWVVAVLVLGPIALLVYILSDRRRGKLLPWQIALSSALHRAVSYTGWLFLAFLFLVIVLPNPGPLHILALVYVLPFFAALLVLGYANNASKSSLGYWVVIRRTLLKEFVAINLSCASMFLTFFLLDNSCFPGAIDFKDPVFWFMIPIVVLSGMLVFIPFYWWLLSRRFLAVYSREGSVDMPDFESGGLETVPLRSAWGGILVSLGMFVGSLWLIVMRMR